MVEKYIETAKLFRDEGYEAQAQQWQEGWFAGMNDSLVDANGNCLPHLLPVVGAYAALSVGWAVLFESALGFLGAGVQEPDASIGSLLGSNLVYYRSHPGLILFPALFLGLLVLAANVVGESMRTRTEESR